jgi:hypothetical protein
MADPVEDKTRRNFCEYFYFSLAPFAVVPTSQKREADARAKLAGLFKDAPQAPKKQDARDKLESLFRKKPEKEEGAEE